ncbi:neprilysin-4-like isoform X2 [Leptopilina boulardi]|uniref:neprilysin-4-like isoform X2 n=1 Tax=Leptopilina boulardi TaxID=63433 RepID=UPI0021F6339F|nr:neprilysin-4-like isoform X2 [Leptopilina boulardi]
MNLQIMMNFTKEKSFWLDDDAKEEAENVVDELKLSFTRIDFPVWKNDIETSPYNFKITLVAFKNFLNFKKAKAEYRMLISFQYALMSLYDLVSALNASTNNRKKRNIEIEASFNRLTKSIEITPGLLLPPFFHPEAPMAYNFGRLAFIIGHEISHTFDFENMKLHTGSLFSINNEINSIYSAKKYCLERQFNNLNIDGVTTLDENVADTQGLKLAFRAMRRLFHENPDERNKVLPQFQEFDANQLFFLSFANQYCENRNEEFLDSIHAPYDIRTIGTIMNSHEFAEAFQCEKGQFMNPKEKCDLWTNPNL